MLKEEFVRKYEEEYAQKVAAEEEALKAAAKKKGKRAPMAEPMPKVPPPPKIPDEMRDLGMDTHVEPEVVVETTEEEVRAAMLASEDPRQPAASTGEQLCFAAVVYCLDERCESLWPDLMVKAFEHFQTKDYCLVMLPHDSKVPPMLRDFARVPSVPGSKFPEQLYIFHRFGLIRDFEVRSRVCPWTRPKTAAMDRSAWAPGSPAPVSGLSWLLTFWPACCRCALRLPRTRRT